MARRSAAHMNAFCWKIIKSKNDMLELFAEFMMAICFNSRRITDIEAASWWEEWVGTLYWQRVTILSIATMQCSVVTTDKVRAWLHLEGNIIKSKKFSQKSWKRSPSPLHWLCPITVAYWVTCPNSVTYTEWHVAKARSATFIYSKPNNVLQHAWPPWIYQNAVQNGLV